MTQVATNRFNIIPSLNTQHCICMPQIMYTMLYKKIAVCRDAVLSLEICLQELSDLAGDCDGDLAKRISIAACLSTYSIKESLKQFNQMVCDFEEKYQKTSVQV